ncbi:Proline--tRNA ligase [uncultured archaeon]|nr:Proline--tRNA ligase [uncultured archaeon]
MFARAQKWLADNSVQAKTWKDFEKAAKEKKLIYASWCCTAECAEKIKSETEGVKCLTLPFSHEPPFAKCILCEKPAKSVGVFAKSY